MRLGLIAIGIVAGLAAPILVADGTAANAAAPGSMFRDCEQCPEMVVIPAGSFTMGSPEKEIGHGRDEEPLHAVEVPAPFAVGRFEVTRDEFGVFVDETGRDGMGCQTWDKETKERVMSETGSWRNPGFEQADRHPVVCVNWEDAKAYAAWLSDRTGQQYRLLTEAEWEYAARAGTTTARFWGDAQDQACAHANVHDLSGRKTNKFRWAPHFCDDGFGWTAPVGSFPANGFGLHDMLGNVWEWTEDCWHDNYEDAPDVSRAWADGGNCEYRVIRGGGWTDPPRSARAADRAAEIAAKRNDPIGFRLARSLD